MSKIRNVPFVIDPFAFSSVDAVLATHYHQDHMSAEWAAHVINSGMTTTDENGNTIPVPFIGPKKLVETWIKWGVPEDRCIVVKPGDVIKLLYDFKKDRNEYKFHPFFWQVGGKYTYPLDKDKIYYHHRRGFEDCFEAPQNIPFRSCL